ncbi:MAG: tRNA uridine-5-carboxymethylaminomethyl(34) synthesis GTPase MnmE [Candidatus Melainabacteria bacterium HGW-Melainabacteria-1]|nr:MAG: tRNA uridine-5-carboxymethylaminomethyl(34) synthesis GTPase MnmE [Candidatus Melainabacteria bacterium HGW-Melainabacteria-1]
MPDTIAAVSTPPGNGAIGIVRLSGPEAASLARRVFRGGPKPWPSHKAIFGSLQDPRSGEALDQGLLLYMQGPHSYTGEDIVEFHCHGGSFLIRNLLQLLLELGARLAEPGEFTQRAFLNGRLDLTQAEAVADLIHGQSRKGLNLAAHQLEGHLSQPIRAVRHDLIGILAAIEACIDFPDEVDPPDQILIRTGLDAARTEIVRLLGTSDAGRIWQEGLKLAIVGEPNVGKSTLLNALLRYDRAIVSEIPGTTRDTVEDNYNLRGIPVRIIDTAGLRQTTDVIEAIGIERSQKAVTEADLVLVVAEAASGLSADITAQLAHWRDKDLVLVWNKVDQGQADNRDTPAGLVSARVSALTGEGLEALETMLFDLINKHHNLDQPIGINERHRLCLLRADEALERMAQTLAADLPLDFLAIDLKEAIVAFGEVIGESVSEEVINEIFHRFCVGK